MKEANPINILCIANPNERCFSFKLSATKALKGSIVMLILESKIHNTPAAIQTVGALGITINNAELRPADPSTVDTAVQVVNPVPAPPVLGGGFVFGNGANTPVALSNPQQGIVNDDQGKPQ